MNTLAYLALSSATKEKSLITLTPGVSVIKLFFFISDDGAKLTGAFNRDRFIQPGLIFAGKDRRGENLKGALLGQLGWKGLPRTTPLA